MVYNGIVAHELIRWGAASGSSLILWTNAEILDNAVIYPTIVIECLRTLLLDIQ